MDRRFTFIRQYDVTDASCYDGHKLEEILDPQNTASQVWGDTAYQNAENEALLKQKGHQSQLHRKKPRGREIPVHIHKSNRKKSTIRAHVEHVFAGMKHRMHTFIRTIGIDRAQVKLGFAHLAYNMQRFAFWEKRMAQTG